MSGNDHDNGTTVGVHPRLRRVYVACGLTRAPKDFQDRVEALKKRLTENKICEVLCFWGVGTEATDREVYEFDIGCVQRCDALVAICDKPSTGMGMEIQKAIEIWKPVLAVAQTDTLVSAMVIDPSSTAPYLFRRYEMLEEVDERVREFLATVFPPQVLVDAAGGSMEVSSSGRTDQDDGA